MRLRRWCWPALIGLILLCAAMPPSLFGVGYVSDRIPLVVALLLVSALAMSHPMGRGVRAVLAALFAIGPIGRAHVRTPVTNAHLVCRLLLEIKTTKTNVFVT